MKLLKQVVFLTNSYRWTYKPLVDDVSFSFFFLAFLKIDKLHAARYV